MMTMKLRGNCISGVRRVSIKKNEGKKKKRVIAEYRLPAENRQAFFFPSSLRFSFIETLKKIPPRKILSFLTRLPPL